MSIQVGIASAALTDFLIAPATPSCSDPQTLSTPSETPVRRGSSRVSSKLAAEEGRGADLLGRSISSSHGTHDRDQRVLTAAAPYRLITTEASATSCRSVPACG